MTIELKDLEQSRLRHAAHLDGPRGKDGWFGDMHQCIQYPRLQRIVRYYRKDRSHKIVWLVDNQEIGENLADVLSAINKPVVLTEGEQRALAQVADEYQDLRRTGGIELTDLLALSYKGQIEFKDGKCRRLTGNNG